MMEVVRMFLILGGTIGFVLFMRWLKGCWAEAILAIVLAPLIFVSLGFVASIGLMWVGHIAAEIFLPGGVDASVYIEAFAFWGSVVVVGVLFILYCFQSHHGSKLKRGPRLSGGSTGKYGESAKGAWRNDSETVGIFRRKF